MAKKSKSAPVATDVVLYHITEKGQKAGCRATTKWPIPVETNTAEDGSTGGNAATLAAIARLGETFTLAQYRDACAARNHKGFASYGLRNGWIAQVDAE